MQTLLIGTTNVVIIKDPYWRTRQTKRGTSNVVGKLIKCAYCSKPKFIDNDQLRRGVGVMHRKCKNYYESIKRREDVEQSKKVIIRNAISKHVSNARTRGLAFELTKEDVEELIFKNCFYCGSSPELLYYDRTNIKFIGIDRVNNRLGYIKGNCVPCCIICNRAKHALTPERFMKWLEQIVKFRNDMETVK